MSSERLYALVPAALRLRDVEQGGPLRALCQVLEDELDALHADALQLVDDAFPETAQDAVLPYLAELLGVPDLPGTWAGGAGRSYLAHAIAIARRNGTPGALEQAAADVTTHPALVREMFQHLVTTAHANHPRTDSLATPHLRDARPLRDLRTPFGGAGQSGIGRETHKMMLDHYQQTKNMLVSYNPNKLGFF